jgi:hypothetical protein
VVPGGLPATLASHEARVRFQQSLLEGDPEPLRIGDVWMFPRRREDGALLIHLLNLNYSPQGDRISPQRNFVAKVPNYGMQDNFDAFILGYDDEERVAVAVSEAQGVLAVKVPELRLWAVIVLEPANSDV